MKKLFRKKVLWLPIFFILCMTLLFGLGFDDIFFSDEVVNIGLIVELSGSLKSSGIPLKNAVLLAVSEINKKGGLMISRKRYPINVIVIDDQSSGDKAKSAVLQLINRDVVAIIGPGDNQLATSVAPITQGHNVILISPWSRDTQTTMAMDKKANKFVSDYQKQFKSIPSNVAFHSYDASEILFNAISISGSDTSAIATALRASTRVEGIIGMQSVSKINTEETYAFKIVPPQ